MIAYTLITVLVVAIWVVLLLFVFWGSEFNRKRRWLAPAIGVLGLLLTASGVYLALKVSPPEREMGDVFRIVYCHVPADWMALMALTLNCTFSVAYLIR